MSADRHPDRGDVDSCRRARWRVEDIAGELTERRALATGAVDAITDAVWAGQSAQAFRDATTTATDAATTTADGWLRLGAAIGDYASALSDLQAEADHIRSRLSSLEEDVRAYRAQATAANRAVLTGNTTEIGRARYLTTAVEDAEQAVRNNELILADIADRRRALDDRTIDALLTSPGPGARAWDALAFGSHGAPRSTEQIVDDLVDLLTGDHDPTAEDYALLAQLLAMHSSDPETMALFYDGLGPDGLAAFMAGLPTAQARDGAFQDGLTAAALADALSSGLVTASLTWDDDTAQRWGRDLIDTMDGYARGMVIPYLLAADGLNPQVAYGALERVEELRTDDPGRFALVTRTGNLPPIDFYGFDRNQHDAQVLTALGAPSVHLMGAIFGQLTQIPAQSREFFTSRDDPVTDYWFGSHNWVGDGFEGPAALLDAIVNDPAALAGRTAVPASPAWTDTVAFAARAAQALGGNLHLTVGAMSDRASVDIAEALATFVPEMAGGMGGVVATSQFDVRSVQTVINGQLVTVPAFDVAMGNLSRLLGIATLDEGALAMFTAALGTYATQVSDFVTSPGHPQPHTAIDLIEGVGSMYALTYGSYAAEDSMHQHALDAAARERLDTLMSMASLMPGLDTGADVANYLLGVTVGNVDILAEESWPDIVPPEAIRATLDDGLETGATALGPLVDRLTTDLPRTEPPYDTSAATFTEALTEAYDLRATGTGAQVGVGGMDVIVLGEDEPRNRIDMP